MSECECTGETHCSYLSEECRKLRVRLRARTHELERLVGSVQACIDDWYDDNGTMTAGDMVKDLEDNLPPVPTKVTT